MERNIHWLGHDTFKIAGSRIIYTDPFKIKRKDAADILLITHDHFDHCSPEDIEKLQAPHTVIVTVADCAKRLSGQVRTVRPGDVVPVDGITIEAVPAYNTNKEFHTKDKGWVGFIITMDGRRIYLAGDTDYIPEMKSFRDIDIALLPVSGTYVMTAEEAVQAALAIRPGTAIPMHYGSIVGEKSDAERFAKGLEGKMEVIILKEE
ncbi:MAG: MBL fold metallo-hydrolase [Thermodesulfovibrionales bacterium]